jgi:hypothetical protein
MPITEDEAKKVINELKDDFFMKSNVKFHDVDTTVKTFWSRKDTNDMQFDIFYKNPGKASKILKISK